MLKTNSKAVKQAVRAYLMDAIRLQEDLSPTATDAEAIRYTEERLRFEKSYEIKRSYGNLQLAFEDWIRGLALDIEYCTADQRDILADWLEETQEEAARYEDEQVDELFYRLITREFLNMVDKAKKEAAKNAE